jgi:hypothetical protein
MGLTERYILKESLGAGISNGAANGACAWYLSAGKSSIPVWQVNGMMLDFPATGLILVFLFSVIALPLQAKKTLKNGIFFSSVPQSVYCVRHFLKPYKNSLRATVLAVVAALLSVPILAALFYLTGISELARFDYTLAKTLYTAALSALLMPLLIVLATRPYERKDNMKGECL